MTQMSQICRIVTSLKDPSLKVFSKCICLCHYLCLCLCLCYCFFLVRSCLFITLIKCLKGHKSLGSLCSVMKTLIVSGARPRDGQGHLLSCSGQLKINVKMNNRKYLLIKKLLFFMLY